MFIMIFLAKNNTVKEPKASGKTDTEIGDYRLAGARVLRVLLLITLAGQQSWLSIL